MERQWKVVSVDKAKKSVSLIQKYQGDNDGIKTFLVRHYVDNILVSGKFESSALKKIHVSGMYPDGVYFEGKKNGLFGWIQGFEDFNGYDCFLYRSIHNFI